MTIQSCFPLHRLSTGLITRLLLERPPDLVPNQGINLYVDVLRGIVSSRPLERKYELLITSAAVLEFVR